jgi:hypothetical protein
MMYVLLEHICTSPGIERLPLAGLVLAGIREATTESIW